MHHAAVVCSKGPRPRVPLIFIRVVTLLAGRLRLRRLRYANGAEQAMLPRVVLMERYFYDAKTWYRDSFQ